MTSSLLAHYGYAAVAILLLLENLGIPLPGEAVLIAAAVSAGNGGLNIWLVASIALVASVSGALIGYAIGASGGRTLLERHGSVVRLTPPRLERIEDFVNRRGVPLIVVGRFIEGVRQFSGLIAGFSEMTWPKFFGGTVVGAVLWVAAWASLGYLAGNHVDTIEHYATYIAIAAFIVAVAWFGGRRLLHRRRTAA